MRTTINDLVDRRGGAYSVEDLETILNRARKLLADTSALLELEIDELFALEFDLAEREKHVGEVTKMIKQVQKLMITVMDIEAKAGLSPEPGHAVINLEEARDEILRRLTRLTA